MQKLRYSRYLKSIIILIDVLVLVTVFLLFFAAAFRELYSAAFWQEILFPLLLLLSFWLLLSGRTSIYSIPRNLTFTLFIERLIIHFIFFVIGLLLIRKVSNSRYFGSELMALMLYLTAAVVLVKSGVFFIIKFLRARGINNRNVMFLYPDASAKILQQILQKRKDYGYRIFTFEEDAPEVHALTSFWKKKGIHTVFMPNDFAQKRQDEQIFRLAEEHKVHISLIPDITKSDFLSFDLAYLESQPILNQTKFPLEHYTNAQIKRLFDVLFSVLVLLLVCTWLFPIIAVLIKQSSPGPVFFRQRRYGFHDEVFTCLKFRTMVINEDSARKTTAENDVRITKIGRFLRKTSLDEMPQFINVLKGEMSVVGPRPHMLAVDDYFKPRIGRYSLRSSVSPGITGLAQISGLRGDHGDAETEMKKRILADAFYVKNWSFVMDLVIILKTVWLVFWGDKKAN